MTGIRLRSMLQHPRWADVHDLSLLDADPLMTGSAIIRDVTGEVPERRDALLVVMYAADRNDWRLDTLLNRAASRGIAALLVESHRPLQSSTLGLARRFALPVLGAPEPLAAREAFERLSGEVDLERAEFVLRVLARAAQAGPGVEDLLGQVATALGRPVALLDGQGTALAGGVDIDPPSLKAVLPMHVPGAGGGVRLTLEGGDVLLVHPVRAAGTYAWLAAHVPVELPAEIAALETALTAVAPTVEQRLAVARMSLERDARRRTSLLGEILQGPITPAIRRRALDLGWELDGWHTGMQIGLAPEVDYSERRSEAVAVLDAEGLPAVVVESGDGWAAWITSSREPVAEEVRGTANAIRRVHHRLGATLQIHTGVGRPHQGPEGLGRSLTEAGDAARLAQGRPESGHFLHIDRLGLAQLLLAWTRTDTFQPAARSLLAPLADSSGDLIATLSAYLDAESSVAEAAAILGVHRNTVASRIRRVESMLRVDLAVPDDRLALHLACRTALGRPLDQ